MQLVLWFCWRKLSSSVGRMTPWMHLQSIWSGLIKKVLGKDKALERTHAEHCEQQQHVWFFSSTKCIRNYPIKEMDFSLLLFSKLCVPVRTVLCEVVFRERITGWLADSTRNLWKNNWRNDPEWDNLYRPLVSSPPPSLCLSCMVTFSKKGGYHQFTSLCFAFYTFYVL